MAREGGREGGAFLSRRQGRGLLVLFFWRCQQTKKEERSVITTTADVHLFFGSSFSPLFSSSSFACLLLFLFSMLGVRGTFLLLSLSVCCSYLGTRQLHSLLLLSSFPQCERPSHFLFFSFSSVDFTPPVFLNLSPLSSYSRHPPSLFVYHRSHTT